MPELSLKHKFENWSRTIEFTPREFLRPRTIQEVVDVVLRAGQAKGCVRTQGAGHSFSQLLATRDTLIKLDLLDEPGIHWNGPHVTVPAGMPLKHLLPKLKQIGLGMPNLGSITEQSIAGAFSTGTHGTGIKMGAIGMQVVAMKIVTGTGHILTVDHTTPDLLNMARLSVGTLGVIIEVTLECVRHYQVEYRATLYRFDDIVDQVLDLARQNERLLLWWLVPPIGRRDKVVLVTKNNIGPTPLPASPALPAAAASALGTGITLRQDTLELHNLLAAFDPSVKKPIPLFTRRGDYEDMLTIPLLPVYHREMEYAIPSAKVSEALREMRRVFEEGDISLRLPVEVRFCAQDSMHLSPANRGEVCWIGASSLSNATEVFDRFEPMMKELGGRPHWGKHFHLTRAEVDAMYGESVKAFRQKRLELDPDGVFLNTLLEGLFR